MCLNQEEAVIGNLPLQVELSELQVVSGILLLSGNHIKAIKYKKKLIF